MPELKDYMPLILSGIACIVWFVRIESKVLYLEKEKDAQQKTDKEKDTLLWAKLDGIQLTMNALAISVAKLETRADNKDT